MSTEAPPLIQIKNVSRTFHRGSEEIHVLSGLNLEVKAGDFLALMGPSGSGKSTLLNLIGGLDRADQGSVQIGADRVDQLNDRQLAAWRARHVGFVFQFYNLMPALNAARNVELPLLLTHLSKSQRKKHVETALGIVGLSHRLTHYPRTLSGGEQQRVGIARAIVSDPTLLLCDEPTGDLDRKSGDEILSLLQALNREHGKTIVMVTHDPHASARASHTVYLDKGQLSTEAPGMKFLALVFSNLKRKKLRTSLTLLSIFVAFLLFGFLSAIKAAFLAGVDLAGADRLIVRHKVALIQPLPQSYEAKIEAIPGVDAVASMTWFGGIYKDPKNFIATFPVDPDKYLGIYNEMVVAPDVLAKWKQTRNGAVVGKTTFDRMAKKEGWKIGDRIPFTSPIWGQPAGQAAWEFEIVGIYTPGKKGADDTGVIFRYDYFEEARQERKGTIGWFGVRVKDASQAAEVAKRIDEQFANSPHETKAEAEGAFAAGFASQIGDIGTIVAGVVSAVFFTILLVAGNTMSQSVRERTEEIGVLKAMGYPNGLVLVLVLLESCIIALLGGLAGLGLAWLVTLAGSPIPQMLPVFIIPHRDMVLGVIFAVGLGLLAGTIPAYYAMRLQIAVALRKLG